MGAIAVAVGTYGDPYWRDLAYARAVPTVPEDVPVIHRHGLTLAQARNEALALVDTEFVIFLDADDELDPLYVQTMGRGTADLRAPSVERDGIAEVPRVVGHNHACSGPCLEEGNFIAIGACARTELLRSVGGFQEEPLWEDWSLWLRCWRAGASVETIPQAIYRAHPGSRNASLSRAERLRVFEQIAA